MSWLQSERSPHGVSPSRHPKTKNTNRHCQMSSNTPRQPSGTPKMHDQARLEPIPHFGKTVKGKNFLHLPFLRHQNIKTSLYAIFLNFHACQRKITIYSLFWSPCSSTQFCNVLMRNCTTTTHIIIIIHIMISFISKLSILGQNMEYWPFKFLNKGMKMDWPPPLPPGCESLS